MEGEELPPRKVSSSLRHPYQLGRDDANCDFYLLMATWIATVWIEKTLSIDPKFKDLFENFLKAAFERVDFRSKAEEVLMEVNSWVQERTNDLIKYLLPPDSVTNETERVYANAFCFAYDGFKVARLPFQRGGRGDTTRTTFAMYFYLPRKKEGFNNLVERITTTPGFLDAHIPSGEVKVGSLGTFRIPKFEMSFGFLVSEVFNQLGLQSTSVHHKSCIKIDESGVEAAVVTAAEEACDDYLGMEFPKRIDFVANKPFLFLIREDTTGTVLFVGQIFDPSQSS
ncbi:unnamed protein product [Eruca vesicaria subsp. sativa]|uniref:Serpin domain-containing protein n=1 Tax=Eruca vesicaria subsp. sativa TaxID=29727 RepID=A0ABC8LB39_ERUVS|nr:unnamed protein product [Eruca vesicaria subsp. sativa]